MELDEILSTIKKQSLTEIKDEFKDLMDQAKKDKSEFIKSTAKQVSVALSYRAQGLLDQGDVDTLLKKLKKIAQIQTNTVRIQTLAKIQKIIYRILDIAIDVLVKTIVPIA